MEEGRTWKRLGHGRGWDMEEVGTWKRVGHGRGWDMGGKEMGEGESEEEKNAGKCPPTWTA